MSNPTTPVAAPPRQPPLQTSEAGLALVVDIWKHGVDVQMHFNDMGMKIRNLYFTILAAALGVIGVLQGRRIEIPFPHVSIHLVLFVIVAIIPLSALFFFLDKYWYHQLLLGAVIHCATIEDDYKNVLPEIRLGDAITKKSPAHFPGVWRWWFWFIRDGRYRQHSRIHSDAKIEVLYKSVMVGALLLAVPYAIVDGIDWGDCTTLAWVVGQCHPNWDSGEGYLGHWGPK